MYRQRILTFLQSQSRPFIKGQSNAAPINEAHQSPAMSDEAVDQADQQSYRDLDQAVRETLDAAGLLKKLTQAVTSETHIPPSESFEEQSKKALHDLRTPLNAVMGYGGLLAQEGLDKAMRARCLKAFHDSGDALLEILNHGFQTPASHMSSTQTIEAPARCDAIATAEECFDLIAFEAKERDIILFNRMRKIDEQTTIEAVALKRVLLNLLSNALRYTDSGGAIELTNMSDETHLYISVTDTGCGMSDATLNRAMAHGTRGLEAKLKAPEGQGIGLANAQELLKLAGGSIKVTSKIDSGTKAVITLPLISAHTAGLSADCKPANLNSSQSNGILPRGKHDTQRRSA